MEIFDIAVIDSRFYSRNKYTNSINDSFCLLFSEKGLEIFKLDDSVLYDSDNNYFKFKDIERFQVFETMSIFSKSFENIKNKTFENIIMHYDTFSNKSNDITSFIKYYKNNLNNFIHDYNITDEMLLKNVEKCTDFKIGDVKFLLQNTQVVTVEIINVLKTMIEVKKIYSSEEYYYYSIKNHNLYNNIEDAAINMIQDTNNKIKDRSMLLELYFKFINDIPKNVKILKNYKPC